MRSSLTQAVVLPVFVISGTAAAATTATATYRRTLASCTSVSCTHTRTASTLVAIALRRQGGFTLKVYKVSKRCTQQWLIRHARDRRSHPRAMTEAIFEYHWTVSRAKLSSVERRLIYLLPDILVDYCCCKLLYLLIAAHFFVRVVHDVGTKYSYPLPCFQVARNVLGTGR